MNLPGEDERWKSLLMASTKAFVDRRFDEMQRLIEAALAEAEKFGPEDIRVSIASAAMAEWYDHLGKHRKAQPYWDRFLAIMEKDARGGHAGFGAIYEKLGLHYHSMACYDEAECAYKQSLAMTEALGKDSIQAMSAREGLAQLYMAQGRFPEAEETFEQVLALLEKQFGTEHPFIAGTLGHLAHLYRAQDRYDEAERVGRQGLAILERQGQGEHIWMAMLLSNLASIQEKRQDYAGAEALIRRSLAIARKYYGPRHPDVGDYFGRLARISYKQGKYRRADRYLAFSLRILKALGAKHPRLVKEVQNLATFFLEAGDLEIGRSLLKETLAVLSSTLGMHHPETTSVAFQLAVVTHALQEYIEAERLYRRALAVWEELLGPDNPWVAEALEKYAELLRQTNRAGKANEMALRAKAIRHGQEEKKAKS